MDFMKFDFAQRLNEYYNYSVSQSSSDEIEDMTQ